MQTLQMFEESVKICNEGLKKVCDNTTVGAGEEVRKFESSENFLLWSILKVKLSTGVNFEGKTFYWGQF